MPYKNKEEGAAKRKAYYEKNKIRIKERSAAKSKQYRLENRDKIIVKSREWYAANKERRNLLYANNIQRGILNSSRQTAKNRGWEHTIELEDIVIPTHCPILGQALTNIRGRGRNNYNPSIDRIDSTKGYIKGNVQVISDLANRMKSNATPEELVLFAKGILNLFATSTPSVPSITCERTITPDQLKEAWERGFQIGRVYQGDLEHAWEWLDEFPSRPPNPYEYTGS